MSGSEGVYIPEWKKKYFNEYYGGGTMSKEEFTLRRRKTCPHCGRSGAPEGTVRGWILRGDLSCYPLNGWCRILKDEFVQDKENYQRVEVRPVEGE